MIYNYNVFLYIAARVHFYRFLYVWRLFVATVTKGTIIMGEGVHFWVALNAYDNYYIILIIILFFTCITTGGRQVGRAWWKNKIRRTCNYPRFYYRHDYVTRFFFSFSTANAYYRCLIVYIVSRYKKWRTCNYLKDLADNARGIHIKTTLAINILSLLYFHLKM